MACSFCESEAKKGQIACRYCRRVLTSAEAAPNASSANAGVPTTKRCPFCAEEIQADAVVCRYCGRIPITPEVQAYARQWWKLRKADQDRIWSNLSSADRTMLKTAAEGQAPRRGIGSTLGVGLSLGCAVLAILIMVFMLTTTRNEPRSLGAQHTANRTPTIGDEVTLKVSSGKVVVCVDEAAYDEFVKLAVADDTLGMAEQTLAGRSFLVESGTRAKIIDSGFERRRVRILEGAHMGRSGWVTSSLVRK